MSWLSRPFFIGGTWLSRAETTNCGITDSTTPAPRCCLIKMDNMDPIENATNSSGIPEGESSLQTITMGVSDADAIDAEVPDVLATAEEKL
jgi:hypothetical protein